MLIVNQGTVPPTLNVNPTLLSFLVKFLGDCRFTMWHLLSLTKWFFIQTSIIHDNISSQVIDKRRYIFDQWMNSSIIYDNICSLIHRKCHPKSYHSDIKFHMTLDIIFSVFLTPLILDILLLSYLSLSAPKRFNLHPPGSNHIVGQVTVLTSWARTNEPKGSSYILAVPIIQNSSLNPNILQF